MSAAANGASEVTAVKLCPRCGTRYDAAAIYCQQDGAMLDAQGSDDAPDPYVGTTILDQLQVIEMIGTGGMGTVYRARQTGVERDVAVKILHRELVHNDEAMRRFQREARVASSLEHPNVVGVHMFGQLPDGNLYMAMELMRGQTLLEAMQLAHRESPHGGMDPARALHIVLQICDAVGEAHRRGIVHRDVKPENVFLVRRGKDPDFVKVLDFGIARFWMGSETVATKTGLVFGTAKYISPEGASGEHTDARSDVYSIGVLLFHMIAGEPPFDSPSPVALLMKHIHEQAPPLLSRPGAAHVPVAIADVVMRCLAKNPAARYDDAGQLGDALRDAATQAGLVVEIVQGRLSLAGYAPPWTRSSRPPSASPPVARDAPPAAAQDALEAAPGAGASAAVASPLPEADTERPSFAPLRPSMAVDGMHIVDNEPMEIESAPHLARARDAGPSSWAPPDPAAASRPATTRLRPSPAAAAGSDPVAAPPGVDPVRAPTPSASGLGWTGDEDEPIPGQRRVTWLPWALAALFFAVGAAAVAAAAWRAGVFSSHTAPTQHALQPRIDLVALETRARAALDRAAYDSPEGENVRDLTDTILAAHPDHAGALALRRQAADRLERAAADARRQGRAEEALSLVGRALALAPRHGAANRLLQELRSPGGARAEAATSGPGAASPVPTRGVTPTPVEPAGGGSRGSARSSRRGGRSRGGSRSGPPDLGEIFPGGQAEPAPTPPAPEAPAGNPGDAVDWSIPEDSREAPPPPESAPPGETSPAPTPQPQPPPGGNDLAPNTPAPWVGGTGW